VVGAVLAVLAFAAAAIIASLPSLQTSATGTRVVVAKHDIKARTIIQDSDLDLVSFSQVPPQAFFAVKDVAGKGARVDIPSASAITSNLVAPSGDLLTSSDVAYLPIPEGWVAVTVPTGELIGVGGYVLVGDRISVLATINTSAFGKNPGISAVRTVFRDVYVIRVGPAGTPSTSGSGTATGAVTSSLTLLMTGCDSEYLFWLLNNATLKYELESYKDYGAAPNVADQSCPSVKAAGGVGPAQVDKKWQFTSS
jgi:pilus assembly protein CpaB